MWEIRLDLQFIWEMHAGQIRASKQVIIHLSDIGRNFQSNCSFFFLIDHSEHMGTVRKRQRNDCEVS